MSSTGTFRDLLGTLFNTFQLGLGGPKLKANGGSVEARSAADDAYAAIRAALVSVYGNDIEINAGAAGSGADWKMTLRRPSTGMTHNLAVVMPGADPSPGQALTVASLTGDVITLQWTTVAVGTDKLVVDTTTIAFGSTSPVAMFSLPVGAIVEKLQVIVDTPFNGTPSLSIGVTGTTSKYLASTQADLTAAAGTVFEVAPGQAAGAGEALIATYAAGSATAGSARVLVAYVIPS